MNILVDGQTLQSPEVNRGIGVYFKNVLNNMVKQSFIHNWYIAVENRSCLTALDPWVSERLIPVEHEIFSPSSDYDRTSAYTDAIEKVVMEKKIDIFWCPNPLMTNVLFINRTLKCRMFVTLYDIIPFIMPITEWSKEVHNEYTRRLTYLKEEAVSLLCISNATKVDFEKHIGSHPAMYVTPLAADSKKFYRRCRKAGISENVSIVFTGGFDYRKNMNGALQAFAKACKKYRGNRLIDSAKLSIVCTAPQEAQERFYHMAEKLGVRNRVVLTGFLSDWELAELYHHCSLFFFPSLYEGFGLPIVEAMLSGAFILSADNSSLPEVCGGHALLCDANDIDGMADKIMGALMAANCETLSEKRRRQEYALTFSWQKTAKLTLEVFEGNEEPDVPAEQTRVGKKKLAIITPWPTQKTGIANYVYKLTPYLAEYFDIDIFVDNLIEADAPFLENKCGGLYMLNELDWRHSDYDYLLYQIGNSAEYHSGVYRYLKKYPGIAEIHDYILHPFFYHAYFLKNKKSTYRTALIQGYGKAGLHCYEEIRENRGSDVDCNEFPMSHSVAAISKKVLFHNHWSKLQMQDVTADVIPLACFEREGIPEDNKERLTEDAREKHGLRESEILISCFGFVNNNKRPEVVLQAFKELRDRGHSVKLVFWGKPSAEGLEEIICRLGLNDVVHVTGYLERSEYAAGMALSDIVINLRYPSMGEASATLCETFKYGKPVIVTGINQYREFPDEVCWKVPVGADEVKCLVEMTAYLIKHPKVRRALGRNAQNYANKVLSPAKIARQYFRVLK